MSRLCLHGIPQCYSQAKTNFLCCRFPCTRQLAGGRSTTFDCTMRCRTLVACFCFVSPSFARPLSTLGSGWPKEHVCFTKRMLSGTLVLCACMCVCVCQITSPPHKQKASDVPIVSSKAPTNPLNLQGPFVQPFGPGRVCVCVCVYSVPLSHAA